jgi:hypothetical protein
MRMRSISTAVVLALGIVGITLAQQGGEKMKQQATDRAKLRSQVANLRAEVEVLQLEHDADSDILKKLMVDMKNLESMEAAKAHMKEQMGALLEGPMKEQMEALKRQTEALKADTKGLTPTVEEALPLGFNEMFNLNEATAKVGRPVLDRLKKQFVQKAAELNEKRLELSELEKRYNEAR